MPDGLTARLCSGRGLVEGAAPVVAVAAPERAAQREAACGGAGAVVTRAKSGVSRRRWKFSTAGGSSLDSVANRWRISSRDQRRPDEPISVKSASSSAATRAGLRRSSGCISSSSRWSRWLRSGLLLCSMSDFRLDSYPDCLFSFTPVRMGSPQIFS